MSVGRVRSCFVKFWERFSFMLRLFGDAMSLFSSSDDKKKAEFQEVLSRYGDIAYRMALQLTRGNEEESRELVQEAFVRLWKRWDAERPESFQGWLYRVLHNLYMDALRRRVRQVSFTALQSDDP